MSGSLSINEKNGDLESKIRLPRFSFFNCPGLMRRLLLTSMLSGLIVLNIPAASKRPATSRYKFETNIGYGFPESICVKAKYGNQIQFGLSQAFDTRGPGPSGLEIYYRFGEKPRGRYQSPWYFLGGVAGYIFNIDYKKEYDLLLYPRAGRSFYFSKISGINVDIGLGFPLGRDRDIGNPISPVLITGSMTLFLKF